MLNQIFLKIFFRIHMKVNLMYQSLVILNFTGIVLLGYLEIHSNNATKMLDVAHKFQIIEVIEARCRFIERRLQPSNCFGLYRFEVERDLPNFKENIWNYILVCFSVSFILIFICMLRNIFRKLFKIIMNFFNYHLMKLNNF